MANCLLGIVKWRLILFPLVVLLIPYLIVSCESDLPAPLAHSGKGTAAVAPAAQEDPGVPSQLQLNGETYRLVEGAGKATTDDATVVLVSPRYSLSCIQPRIVAMLGGDRADGRLNLQCVE